MKKAKEFKHWVTSEVLPSIRKTGNYNMNMTDEEKIRLIAKGNVKLNERIDKVEDKISSLENDMPLYGCEIDEVQKHIKRKVVDVLGGKNTSAYKDSSVRSSGICGHIPAVEARIRVCFDIQEYKTQIHCRCA